MTGRFISMLLVGTMVLAGACFAVEVDGFCYLEGQSDHSGTKVLFEADSPYAITDSTFTDAAGYYQIDMSMGNYNVIFIHEGYVEEIIENLLVFQLTTLDDVELVALLQGVPISGELSGVLLDTVYLVEGTIRILDGDTLVIEPGADFYFVGNGVSDIRIDVEGYIRAVGAETDSIRFLVAPNGYPFGDINLYTGSSGRFEYCVFRGFQEYGIEVYTSGSTIISHCTFSHSGFEKLICCRNLSSPIISYCTFVDNYGSVFYISNGSNVSISNCVIARNARRGIECGGSCAANISNCTIVGNSINAVQIDGHADVVITNTVVAFNSHAGITFSSDIEPRIEFCDFYENVNGNFYGNAPEHLGDILTTNANGDSCDIYFNIYQDPEFVDFVSGDYHLLAGSACIDAGDPNSPLDPDGTIADIGAFYFEQLGVCCGGDDQMPSVFRLMPCYPNPFNPTTTIEFALPAAARVELVVYDVMGRKVATLVDGWCDVGMHKAVFDGSGLASGIYFVRMQAGNFHQVQKMVLLK